MGKTYSNPAKPKIFICIIYRDGTTSRVYCVASLNHARNLLLGEEAKYPKEVFFCPIPEGVIFMNENATFFYMHKKSIALNYNEFKNGKNPWPLDYIPEKLLDDLSPPDGIDESSGV